jgi:hypothetical protein
LSHEISSIHVVCLQFVCHFVELGVIHHVLVRVWVEIIRMYRATLSSIYITHDHNQR